MKGKFFVLFVFWAIALILCVPVFAQVYVNGGMTSSTIAGDLTVSADTSGGNAGARNQISGLLRLKAVALGTMANGSTTTKALMDDTPAAEFDAIGGTSDPTDTEDSSIYRVGSKSLKLAWDGDQVDGDGIKWTAFSGEDWEANESVGMWLYSSAAFASGDLELVLIDDGGARTFSLPAITVPNVWTWVEVDISSLTGGTGDVITNWEILLSSQGETADLGAFDLYVDGAYKWDAASEEALSTAILQDGVLAVVTVATAAGSANTAAVATEYTDYFIHYESGNDFIVAISDQSANSGVAWVVY